MYLQGIMNWPDSCCAIPQVPTFPTGDFNAQTHLLRNRCDCGTGICRSGRRHDRQSRRHCQRVDEWLDRQKRDPRRRHTYHVTFVDGDYTAFNRWSSNAGCQADGTHCSQGWENSAVIVVGAQTFYFGDSGGNGGYGPNPDGSYFASAAQSFAHSGIYSEQFTLAAPASVSFYIYDDNLSDNRGGISLAVMAVPEPAGWPFLLVGVSAIGLLAYRRRKAANA